MARKRKMKTRRRRKQGISLLGLAETVALTNVVTQTAFNVNPVEFLTAKHGQIGGRAFYGTGSQITLRELFSPTQVTGGQRGNPQAGQMQGGIVAATANTTDIVMNNLKENALSGVLGMITVPLTFKLIKNFGRPAISKINATLRKAGIASTVKV